MKRFMAAFVSAALLSAPAVAATTTVDFEGFANGDLVSTVGGATFSSNGSVQINFFPQYAQSGDNTIAPDSAGGLYTGDLFVDFATMVTNVSFYSGGDNNDGKQAEVNVFTRGTFNSTVDLVGDGDRNTVDFHDLSAFSDVTRIEIVDVVDRGGLVYDDFSYTTAPIPLPAGLPLLLVGLASLGALRHRMTT